MVDRDRLIELKIQFVENFYCGDCKPEESKCKKCLTEKETDYLLANDVIVPPCKVGDYVEWDNGLGYKTIKRVNGFYYNPNDSGLRFILEDCSPIVTISNITKILTKEEAEAKLKECE